MPHFETEIPLRGYAPYLWLLPRPRHAWLRQVGQRDYGDDEVTISKARARAQQGPWTKKKATKKSTATPTKSVRSAFHQPSIRDYVKKMTIEVDRDLHAELKAIAARKVGTLREIVGSCLEEYVKKNR